MDLRQKALWGLVGVIIATMVFLSCVSSFVIYENYLNLESSHVRSDVSLAQKTIGSEVTSLTSHTPDWGGWNETYDFARGESPEYVAINLVNTTFRTLRTNFIIITDRDGRILYGQGYDLVADRPVPLRADITDELKSGRILAQTLKGTAGLSGLLSLPSGPVMVSSYPVLHSDFTGPAAGMLVIGRYIDDAEIRLLTSGTGSVLSIEPSGQQGETPAVLPVAGPGAIAVHAVDENTVEGMSVLRDVYGNDSLRLSLQLPRDIYQQGKTTILLFILFQLGALLIIGVLGILVLDRMVLSRMSVISADIIGITETKDRSGRVRATGDDELSRLAGAMNTLLDQIAKTQGELEENEQKFREIFNNANDAIELHEIRPDGLPGRYVEVNDVACRMLQYSREELLGKSPLDFTTDRSSRPLLEIGREINTAGHARFETEHKRRDGTIVVVEINAHRIVIREKTLVLAVVRDITERKRSEESLRQLIKKMNMLSNVTRHDILNQLTGLRGYLDLSKELVKDPVLAGYIQKEEDAAITIQHQIRFTKDYQDIGVHSPQWQDVKQTIMQAVRPLGKEPVQISVNIEGIEILADPLLVKVFYNLAENAIRHGGPSLTRINFRIEWSGDDLHIITEDDGTGIPLPEKENIFNQKYYRHTGLGLFLTREILGMTGMGIRETGEPGKGARFEIFVPKSAYRTSGR